MLFAIVHIMMSFAGYGVYNHGQEVLHEAFGP